MFACLVGFFVVVGDVSVDGVVVATAIAQLLLLLQLFVATVSLVDDH